MGKRTPKRVRYHDVYTTGNEHGEWSVRVEPGGLQIDTFHHKGKLAHLHSGGDYAATHDLPGLTLERATDILRSHLMRNGEVLMDVLIRELTTK